MGQYHFKLPRMGESVTEATVTKWLKQVGDKVILDDPIVEIATDKVCLLYTSPSPRDGLLSRMPSSA